MDLRKIKYWLLTILTLLTVTVYGQEDENLGTETVTVVKSYAPSVSDAFKIKSVPDLNDSIVQQKKSIQYSIFSVPVASTFSPEKGKATPVQRVKSEKLYNSSVRAALGNFSNALLDFYTSKDIDRGDQRLDFALNHLSSRGEIDNTVLDTDFYNTELKGTYAKKERDWDWKTDLAFQHQLYNWYGLPENTFDDATIATIDEKQNYYKVQFGAGINMEDGVLRKGDLMYRRFWDAVNSAENRFVLSPIAEFPLTDASLEVKAHIDYVGGNFNNASLNNTVNTPPIDYGQLLPQQS